LFNSIFINIKGMIMKTNILSKLFGSITMPLFLISCVTINIYFPAAAAEKVADRIIEDVWGKQPGAAKPVPKAPEKTSRNIDAAGAHSAKFIDQPGAGRRGRH